MSRPINILFDIPGVNTKRELVEVAPSLLPPAMVRRVQEFITNVDNIGDVRAEAAYVARKRRIDVFGKNCKLTLTQIMANKYTVQPYKYYNTVTRQYSSYELIVKQPLTNMALTDLYYQHWPEELPEQLQWVNLYDLARKSLVYQQLTALQR